MELKDLRPGMEKVDLRVRIVGLKEPRKVTTYTGFEHVIVDGEVEDGTGRMPLTVWNDLIDQLEGVEDGSWVELRGCFVTSFQGVLSVNVGRDSEIIRIKPPE
ncbi:MAG: hypothetical protein ACE5OO_02245 [Candidatus Bathyarchaeia archaeon]